MGRYDDDDNDDAETEAGDEGTGTTAEAPDPETAQKARKIVKRGWGNVEQVRSAGSPFAQKLKISPDAVLVKFLEDDPYTSYRQHWIEREGQKSFTCISDMHAKGCPLCDAGHRPSARFAFNVAQLSDDGDPVIKSYEVGPRDIDTLKNFHTDPRQGPLPKHYWAISRTGKGSTSQRVHQMVRERDMEEEWDISPLSGDQIDALMKDVYDANIVPIPSRKTLVDIVAEELTADDD